MSASAQGKQANRFRWFVSEPLQFALGALLLLVLVWVAVDLMSRLAGHQGGAWLYGLEGLTLPLLAVAALVLMWQSRCESAAKHQQDAKGEPSVRVSDGGAGLAHPPAERGGAGRNTAAVDGGSFPSKKRR